MPCNKRHVPYQRWGSCLVAQWCSQYQISAALLLHASSRRVPARASGCLKVDRAGCRLGWPTTMSSNSKKWMTGNLHGLSELCSITWHSVYKMRTQGRLLMLILHYGQFHRPCYHIEDICWLQTTYKHRQSTSACVGPPLVASM